MKSLRLVEAIHILRSESPKLESLCPLCLSSVTRSSRSVSVTSVLRLFWRQRTQRHCRLFPLFLYPLSLTLCPFPVSPFPPSPLVLYGRPSIVASISSAALAVVPSSLVRSRYQTRIMISEKKKIKVEMALISGVIPRRSRDQISSGKVLSRPRRKKLTAISSMERVKIKSPAPMRESRRLGIVTRQKVCQ